MDKKGKMKTLLLAIVLCSSFILVGAGLSRIWSRSLVGVQFTVQGIEAFMSTTWDEYQTQTENLNLLDDTTMISITIDDYGTPLWLDMNYSSVVEGMTLICTGQYLELYFSAGNKVISDVGSPFDIPTNGTKFILDTSAMMWADCSQTSVIGYALELKFTFHTYDMQYPRGQYTVDIDFGIGVE